MKFYALDSNIVSYIVKEDEDIIARYRQEIAQNGNEFIIPPIVFYEVQRWLFAKNLRVKQRAFDKFCHKVEIGEFDYAVWLKAAEVYSNLSKQGKPIDDADLLIAAFCLVNDYTLVTNNTRHFERIEGLNYVNWKPANVF